jgi:hypothetical protein
VRDTQTDNFTEISHHINMTPQIESIEPADAAASLACYLPSVRHAHGVAGSRRRMSSRINCDTQKIKNTFKKDEHGVRHLLQAAWALVLHHYTDMPEVCFGYDELDMAVSTRKSGPSSITVRVGHDMRLNDFQDRLKGKEGKYGTPLRSDIHGGTSKSQLHFNTAVVLQTRSSSANATSPAALASQQAAMALPEEVISCHPEF